MHILLIGIALFFLVHLVPLAPGLRASLIGRLGENAYKGAFSLVSAVGLALMVWGYWMSRAGPSAADIVYWPPDWTRPATMFLVFLAFQSVGIYLHRGRLRIWLRNPMSIAIALWSAGHLLSNGKMSSVLLFGAFLIYALIDIAVNTVRGYVPAIVPKPRHDYIAALAGALLFAVFFLFFHPYVLNLPLI
jgi:uncharacterized membrane protein